MKEKATLILAEIKKAGSILLHCHPKPDPDSVGSALAMKFALEQMDKKVTVIKGDSEIPEAFMHFPGADQIIRKNFSEIDLREFDLFICQDSSAPQMVTRTKKLEFPLSIPTVIIDHHRSSEKFGAINLIEDTYPANAQLLYDVFSEWGIKMTPEIASNLFMGIYNDTSGLKYRLTSVRTYEIMAKLVETGIDFTGLLDRMENSRTPASIAYEHVALGNIKYFLGGKLVISSVPNEVIVKNDITEQDMGSVQISSILRTVIGWDLDVALVEIKPGEIKVSLRTRDENKYDVSKLAVALGGGGHKAAAGAGIIGVSLDKAEKLVVAKAKELYKM